MSDKNNKREGKAKPHRLLNLYQRFNRGEVRSKQYLATIYEVDDKTIQRDIDELRYYLESDEESPKTIVYNKNKKGYEMINRAGFKFADRDIFCSKST